MDRRRRTEILDSLHERPFDVAIIGGGINGACLFNRLRRAGYRVLLIEKGDFASGTSQASAMMIWGGLLYLRSGDVFSTIRLCRARERLVRDVAAVQRNDLIFVPHPESRPAWLVAAGLWAYWLLGGLQGPRPHPVATYSEQSFLRADVAAGTGRGFTEAAVTPSDARFVLDWILTAEDDGACPLNYCTVVGGGFLPSGSGVRLELLDLLTGRMASTEATLVVNAAGSWTEGVDKLFGLQAPYVHLPSKGVFLGIPRLPGHHTALIAETQLRRDCMALIPWGPISLWGPTETLEDDLQSAYRPNPEDVRQLLQELNRYLAREVTPNEIVSLRTGVRPLAVRRDAARPLHSLRASRQPRIHAYPDRPWLSLFGGKLTDAVVLAEQVLEKLRPRLRPVSPVLLCQRRKEAPTAAWADSELYVPEPAWCTAREQCWKLEDYLRRRTNLSQWLPRGGLGRDDEHVSRLLEIARQLHDGNELAARADLTAYQASVSDGFDAVLRAVG